MKAHLGGGGTGMAALNLNLKMNSGRLTIRSPAENPSTLLTGGWVGAIAGLAVLEKGKYSCSLPGFEPGTVNPVA